MKVNKKLPWYFITPIILSIVCIVCLLFFRRKKSKIHRKKGTKVESFKVNRIHYIPRTTERYQEPINYPRLRDPEVLHRDIVYDFEPEDLNFHNVLMNFAIRDEDILINDADSQNVHDNKVQRYITTEYGEISKNNIQDSETQLEAIKSDLMNRCLEERTRGQISKVIDRIKERNAHVSSLESSESEVLVNTYNSIKNDPDALDALKQNIYDCIQGGSVVCPTGVVSRIISSRMLNPEDVPRTEHDINQEIYMSASKIMTELDEQDPDFKTKFHKNLATKLSHDYADILTQEEIKKKTEELTRNLY